MSQVHAAWETLAGAQYVESEDESWLNHSGFHLSGDSEDDEVHNLTAEAYVHALNALKVTGHTYVLQRYFHCCNQLTLDDVP